MRTIFIIISTKYFAVFCWDKAKLLHYFLGGVAGREGGTNICTSICIYFGILFNNFSLCPFSKYINTRRGAQTHENTIKNTPTDRSFLCAYIPRGGGGAGVLYLYISFAFSRCALSRIKSNRTNRQRCPVRSNSKDTMSAQRSGKVLESRTMKNSSVLHRPNNFPPPNRKRGSAEESNRDRKGRLRENVSCNWNMLPERKTHDEKGTNSL